MPFSLRAAVAADQPAITAIVRQAGINPRHLEWPRFLVAESEGQVIGVGQVRHHTDSSRELASIAVRPEFQGQGVGSAICRGLIERESGPLYLITLQPLEPFYQRFGFSIVTITEMPPHFRRLYRVAGLLAPILRRMVGATLIVMKRERGALQ